MRRELTWQSYFYSLSLQVAFCSPWPLLLLFPDATNSHRKGWWNFSGHFTPGRLIWGLLGCRSHSSHRIYGAEPQLWLHQKEHKVHILFWALLSLQQKSSRKFCYAESAPHSSQHLGPRREELAGSPWWIRRGTADFLEILQGHTLPPKLSLWTLTMSTLDGDIRNVALSPLICSWDGLPGAQSWRLSGPIINMLRIDVSPVIDLSSQLHSCQSPSLQSLQVL